MKSIAITIASLFAASVAFAQAPAAPAKKDEKPAAAPAAPAKKDEKKVEKKEAKKNDRKSEAAK